jgi:hypothetical protein
LKDYELGKTEAHESIMERVKKGSDYKQSILFYKVDQDKIIIISVRSNAKGPKNYPSL